MISAENFVFTGKSLKELFVSCADVQVHTYEFGTPPVDQLVLLLFCEGMADSKQINSSILPHLEFMIDNGSFPCGEMKTGSILQLVRMKDDQDPNQVITSLFNGELIIFFEKSGTLYTLDIANPPQRKPEEANTEISIRGPRDGFIEELSINVALIRKRLRTNTLTYEKFLLGKRSKTAIALLFISDVIRPEIVEEVRKRLMNVEIDALYGSSQLEEIISDSSYSLFPLFSYSGRPDYVVNCLMNGRFAILTDGAPTAIIAPANLGLLLKTPEDVHNPYYYVSFERILRFIGLLIAIFIPGFYTALVMFHQDQLPFPLLATVTMSRLGLPFPTILEVILLLGLFELFREAVARLPKSIGQTVAVVGGIIIGDASIRAGILSPTMLVVFAINAIATYTISNQSLTGTVSILKIFVLLLSSLLGMFGFLVSIFSITLYLSTLQSFGVPYLSPLSPIHFRDIGYAILRAPWKLMKRRPNILKTVDSTHQSEDS